MISDEMVKKRNAFETPHPLVLLNCQVFFTRSSNLQFQITIKKKIVI